MPILFQDDHLVVVDKPAGFLVVPAPGRRGPTVVDLVSQQLGTRVQAVHRLDEETTGALVLALDDAARTGMEELFRRHAVDRSYLALAGAAPSPPAGRIESRLQEDAGGVMRVVQRGGERAITHYETLERRGRCCLLVCRLETGRRNQIRAHLAALGCPIAGDRKYGFRSRGDENFRRVMLHSWRLRFEHPLRGTEVAVAVLPQEEQLIP
ncbi:MAG: RluA family pseudouridine synthase [Planctomycetes bacterium]|nr:RluA family pseudouridine synthase [Planctomycetota bacterium]MCC7061194.1 RluA family pseudouridine synthase [Planctomycetota bacterium]